MHSGFITYRSSSVHYCRWGSGGKVLVCLHGYGENAESFALLEEALGAGFTILAIDLPFHGQTQWAEGYRFVPADLADIVAEIATACALQDTPWTLMGYSMGGRIALSLLEAAPDKIDRMVLLAPDGLTMNPWYWLATQTAPGNRLFRLTMKHPRWLFQLLRLGNALGAVNRSVYKFTIHYIGDSKIRHDLYIRWTAMRAFRPGIKNIRGIIRQRQLPVRLLYGRHDRIIHSQGGEAFRRNIEDCCSLILLPAGHRLLEINHLADIVGALEK